MGNLIKELANFYEESVKKFDDAGLAEVYKQATDIVFNALKEEAKNYCKLDITIENVKYLNGYFIFSIGTNSVVHFYIKETPGWKYGIWWSPVEKQESTVENPIYETDRLACHIFTQYEEVIDKFKPSASMIVDEFDVYLDKDLTGFAWKFVKDIKFIHDEPYLAFYREMHYSDFNQEYVSRAKAKSYFERYLTQKKLEAEMIVLNDKALLRTIYTILKDDIDAGTCFIHDRGDNWSPRYEIVMQNLFDIKDGCYGLFDLFNDSEATAVKKLWNDTIKDCKNRANKAKGYWYKCCHDSVDLRAADRFNEYFKRANVVDIKKLVEDL